MTFAADNVHTAAGQSLNTDTPDRTDDPRGDELKMSAVLRVIHPQMMEANSV